MFSLLAIEIALSWLPSSTVFSQTYSGFCLEGDVLYWKASEEGLTYAVKTPENNLSQNAVLKSPSFEWDFGFKLGAGYRFSREWDILFRLTHLHTHADTLLTAKNDTVLYPIWIQLPSDGLFADQIKMHWRLHFAFVDALCSKPLHVNARFLITPGCGLKYALVRQKFNLTYRGEMFTPALEEFVRMKNKFWGVGPYGSLEIQCLFSHHFSLCATGGLSAMYGQFYVHEDEDLFENHVKILGLRDTFYRVAVTAEATLLLRWQKIWERSRRRLYFQVGWDSILLFNQNQLQRFFNNRPTDSSGNLGLRGFEWGAGFDF